MISLAITLLRVVSAALPKSLEGDPFVSYLKRLVLPTHTGWQLAPPLVYCSFPLAALNMEPEIDRFLGVVDPIGAEPELSGGLCVHARIWS